jgi:hypothetical protein
VQALIAYLQQFFQWLLGFVDWIFIEFFDVVCAALLAVLNALPLPTWWTTAGASLAALPPGVLYYGQMFDFGTGFAIIVTAVGLRFLIRRLPFIG